MTFKVFEDMFNVLTYGVRVPRYVGRKITEDLRTIFWRQSSYNLFREHRERILSLKNKHIGQPCVLIGGGPSINKMDFNKFRDFVSIACNCFYLKMEESEFVPDYYTVEDKWPAVDNRDEINSLQGVTRIIPYDLRNIIDNPENTFYVNFRRSALFYLRKDWPLFSDTFEDQSFWGGTVMYFNIQLAHYLGCNPIFMVGVDLNYRVPESVKKFGAVLTSTENDENHFDPRYFGPGKRWSDPHPERMQIAFSKAHQELEKKGVELLNAGLDSNLKGIPKSNIFE